MRNLTNGRLELVACDAMRDLPQIVELRQFARQCEQGRQCLDHPPLHLSHPEIAAVAAGRFCNRVDERAANDRLAWKAEGLERTEPLALLGEPDHRGGEVWHVSPFMHDIERARVGHLVARN